MIQIFFLNLPFLSLVYFQIIYTRTTTKGMIEMTNKTKNDRASFFRSSQSIGEECDCFCCSRSGDVTFECLTFSCRIASLQNIHRKKINYTK